MVYGNPSAGLSLTFVHPFKSTIAMPLQLDQPLLYDSSFSQFASCHVNLEIQFRCGFWAVFAVENTRYENKQEVHPNREDSPNWSPLDQKDTEWREILLIISLQSNKP
jgi:hypothetical protein